MRASSALFAGLSSKIIEISRLSGIPGVSVGVIDNGDVIHQASYGLCDVENEVPCDSESTFVLGSVSKAFTATLLAQLVGEGRLKWTDPISEILPEFQRPSSDLSSHATVADLLSHHSGMSAFDSLWLGSDNIPLLNHSDSIGVMSYVPQKQPFRGSWVYNNFAYDVLGHVIERISGSSYSSFMKDRLLRPLGLERTYYTDAAGELENEAKPYYALADASPVRIPPALAGDSVLIGPAGGVRSCVSDLLILYNALMEAAAEEMEVNTVPQPALRGRPLALSQLSPMWTGWNIMPMPLIREHSYGYGWLRAQLPSVLAPTRGDPELSPLVGVGAPSTLAIWHSGDIPGYQTHVTLFPETKQAIVVLTNFLSLNYGSRFISDLLIEALLDNLDNAPDCAKIAKKTADMAASRMDGVYKEIMDGRTRSEPSKAPSTYAGRYLNAIKNFFIDVSLHDDGLYLSFMGRQRDTFKLEAHGDDSFFWFLTHDEAARLARYDGYGAEFFIIRFGSGGGDSSAIDTLWWSHEPSLRESGEAFRRQTEGPEKAVQGGSHEL